MGSFSPKRGKKNPWRQRVSHTHLASGNHSSEQLGWWLCKHQEAAGSVPLCRETQRAAVTPHQALAQRPAGHQASSLVFVTRMRSSMLWAIVLVVGKGSFEPADPLCFHRFLIQDSNLLPALASLPAGSLSSLPASGDLHPHVALQPLFGGHLFV